MSKKDKGSSTTLILLIVVAGLAVLAWKNGWIPLQGIGGSPYSPIYDTDPANDRFIKGDLTVNEMKKLDRLLAQEQKSGERRLSGEEQRRLASNSEAVIDAYGRWRKCYDLMRSRYHVVYPNQRAVLSESR